MMAPQLLGKNNQSKLLRSSWSSNINPEQEDFNIVNQIWKFDIILIQGSLWQECQSEFWLLSRIFISAYSDVKLEYW